MSIKRKKIPHAVKATKTRPNRLIEVKRDDSLFELVNTMKSIKTKSKEAKANEESMDDNNEGRIWYNWLRKTIRQAKKDIRN